MKDWLVRTLFAKVFKALITKYDLDSFQRYVNEENELDIKVVELENRIMELEKDSHPVADFVCTEHGCKATRIQDEFEKFRTKKIDEYNEKKKKRRMAP